MISEKIKIHFLRLHTSRRGTRADTEIFLKCAPNISIDLFTSYLDTFALYRYGQFEFDMSRNFQILWEKIVESATFFPQETSNLGPNAFMHGLNRRTSLPQCL